MVPDTFPDLFYSYSAVWIIMLVYVVLMARRLSRIEKKLSAQDESSQERSS
jgi:CcmD family protein